MLKATLRNLTAHKMRLLMTLLAISLGVAFVAGTMVFTNGMNASLERFFSQEPADVVVTPKIRVQSNQPGQDTNPTMSEDVAGRLASLPGVERATPVINQTGTQILDAAGEVVGGQNALTVGASWSQDQQNDNATLVAGSRPSTADEVAFDVSTADKLGVGVGDLVTILTPRQPDPDKDWTVTAILDLGLPGGATVAIFDFAVAQEYLVGPGKITQVNVTAAEGSSQVEVAETIEAELGTEDYDITTGAEAAADAQDEVAESLGFLNTFLLVFALIAVFVAAFLIFNTFAMLVAQRTRELALLRAIGASREQVRTSVIVESVGLGLAASIVGLVAGLLLARLLRGLFAVFGIDLPAGDLSLTPQIVLVSFGVGTVITLLAALSPAIRASRVPPLAAMRDDLGTPGRASAERLVGGTLLALAATGFAGVGLTSESADLGVAWVGLSAVLGIVAVVVLSAFLARPFLSLIGVPLRRTTIGRMALLNAKRNPRRTAATASALTIGVTLMTIMSVFTTSASATATESIERSIGADFIVTDPSFRPFTEEVFETLRVLPSMAAVTFAKTSLSQKSDRQTLLFGIEPDLLPQMVNLPFVTGSIDSLKGGQVAVDVQFAREFGLNVGDTTTVTFPAGDSDVTIGGIYQPAALFEGVVADVGTATLFGLPDGTSAVYLKVADGGDLEAARLEVESALAAFPTLRIQDQTQLKEDFQAQINRLLAFVFALLGLAVFIAMLGIVNTMQMSVVERTRELGMLRAVGAGRGQVRRMIVLEALLLGTFGAVLGVLLGLLYGFLMQRVMQPLGLDVLGVPWALLALFVVVGAVGGVAAALWPAVRASRLNVLEAIATE